MLRPFLAAFPLKRIPEKMTDTKINGFKNKLGKRCGKEVDAGRFVAYQAEFCGILYVFLAGARSASVGQNRFGVVINKDKYYVSGKAKCFPNRILIS